MARLEKAYSGGVWLAMLLDGNVVPELCKLCLATVTGHLSDKRVIRPNGWWHVESARLSSENQSN